MIFTGYEVVLEPDDVIDIALMAGETPPLFAVLVVYHDISLSKSQDCQFAVMFGYLLHDAFSPDLKELHCLDLLVNEHAVGI